MDRRRRHVFVVMLGCLQEHDQSEAEVWLMMVGCCCYDHGEDNIFYVPYAILIPCVLCLPLVSAVILHTVGAPPIDVDVVCRFVLGKVKAAVHRT